MDYRQKIDYSSLAEYQLCPRKFYFKYILNFVKSGLPNLDLIFGSAWHYGLEKAYLALKDNPSIPARELALIASEHFNKLYEIESEGLFDPEASFPKSPARAADMYMSYFESFISQDSEFHVIGAEVPFRIPLGKDLPDYIGRLDLIMESSEGFLYIFEHKTAKMVNAVTLEGFSNSLQAEGYLTAGNLYYEKIPRVLYNIALCQKTKIDFTRHEVTKSESAIDRFLDETVIYINRLLHEIEMAENFSANDKKALFPYFLRTNATMACTNYFRPCPYLDLCKMRNNPTLWRDNPPQGYEIFEWDPEEHEKTMREKLGEA